MVPGFGDVFGQCFNGRSRRNSSLFAKTRAVAASATCRETSAYPPSAGRGLCPQKGVTSPLAQISHQPVARISHQRGRPERATSAAAGTSVAGETLVSPQGVCTLLPSCAAAARISATLFRPTVRNTGYEPCAVVLGRSAHLLPGPGAGTFERNRSTRPPP